MAFLSSTLSKTQLFSVSYLFTYIEKTELSKRRNPSLLHNPRAAALLLRFAATSDDFFPAVFPEESVSVPVSLLSLL